MCNLKSFPSISLHVVDKNNFNITCYGHTNSRSKYFLSSFVSNFLTFSSIYEFLCLVCCMDLYSSPTTVRVIKSKRMRWVWNVARTGRGVYGVLVRKPEEERPLGRLSRRWDENIKADLQEMGCGGYGLD
jgi:hypothetical protein